MRLFLLSVKIFDKAYLVGVVETAPLIEESSLAVSEAARRLHPLVVEYLTCLSDLGELEFDPISPLIFTLSLCYNAFMRRQLCRQEEI